MGTAGNHTDATGLSTHCPPVDYAWRPQPVERDYDPMKILHVIPWLGLGGSETIALSLAEMLATQHEVTVLAIVRSDSEAMADHRRRSAGRAEIIELNVPGRRMAPLFAPQLAAVVRRLRPDIVHCHTDVADICVSLANRLVRSKLARTIHNTQIWPTHHIIGRLSESGFNDELVVPVSLAAKAAYSKLRSMYGMRASPHLDVIFNGIAKVPDTEYWTRERLVAHVGGDAGKRQMGFVGRLEPQKGLDVLLGSIARLPDNIAAQWELVVVGDGSERASLERQAASLGLMVRFVGLQPGARLMLAAFDLVVVPSRFEGLPLVGIEAQMARVPALVSDGPGMLEAFPPGWPYRFPSEDVQALSEQLVRLTANPPTKDSVIGQIGTWPEQYSVDIMAQKYLSAYERYLSECRTSEN